MNYEQHPLAAKYIPPPEQDNVEAIAADMAKNGFDPNYPIHLYEGKILVGLSRYQAAELAGVEPVFRTMRATTAARLTIANAMRQELEEEAKRRKLPTTGLRLSPLSYSSTCLWHCWPGTIWYIFGTGAAHFRPASSGPRRVPVIGQA